MIHSVELHAIQLRSLIYKDILENYMPLSSILLCNHTNSPPAPPYLDKTQNEGIFCIFNAYLRLMKCEKCLAGLG